MIRKLCNKPNLYLYNNSQIDFEKSKYDYV